MNSIVDLLTALCAHLAEFELPTIASVHVGTALAAPRVTVQLTCHQPSAVASQKRCKKPGRGLRSLGLMLGDGPDSFRRCRAGVWVALG
jgi:hypothetical protein